MVHGHPYIDIQDGFAGFFGQLYSFRSGDPSCLYVRVSKTTRRAVRVFYIEAGGARHRFFVRTRTAYTAYMPKYIYTNRYLLLSRVRAVLDVEVLQIAIYICVNQTKLAGMSVADQMIVPVYRLEGVILLQLLPRFPAWSE